MCPVIPDIVFWPRRTTTNIKMKEWTHRDQMKMAFYVSKSRSLESPEPHPWGTTVVYGQSRIFLPVSILLAFLGRPLSPPLPLSVPWTWPITLSVVPSMADVQRPITMQTSTARSRSCAPSWSSEEWRDQQESKNVTETSRDSVLDWKRHLLMVNMLFSHLQCLW